MTPPTQITPPGIPSPFTSPTYYWIFILIILAMIVVAGIFIYKKKMSKNK